MKLPVLLLAILLSSFYLEGKTQGVLIGTSGQSPDPSAALEVRSTQGGFLPTRLTAAERNALSSPANGLMIFNTTSKCLQIYLTQQGWTDITCDCTTPPSAAFTASATAIGSGGSVNFAVSSPTGGVTYQWTLTGGTPASATGSSTSATYATPGTYSAKLVATNALGCKDSSTTTITVSACPSIGSNSLTFNASSTIGQTGNIQTWTVPNGICTVRIQAWGAQGGGNNGGLGATVTGEFTVTPGETLRILVGQRGGVTSQSSTFCAGGGGGSFVYRNANDALPMLVAAGGGGQSEHGSGGVGRSDAGLSNGGGSGSGAMGGGGNGGGAGGTMGVYSSGGGGGGWLTNGTNGVNLRNPPGEGGRAPRNGGNGGSYSHPSYSGAFGGFGGGGGASDNSGAGGGGGGFNGGGGGNNYVSSIWGCGAGGGSYNAGANPTGQNGVRSGAGQVTITW